MTTLAFDVYGTLIDTTGMTKGLTALVGHRAKDFSTQWRLKQLEYTWRYGLMDQYRDFRQCTRQALDWTCQQFGFEINVSDKESLMALYLELPPFDDVPEGLERLRKLNVGLYAFSNGVRSDLEVLLHNAGLMDCLDGIVSVDDKRTFKPNPLLYQYMVERGGSKPQDTYLVSSNMFDICGAVAAGLPAFWVQREPTTIFDPWEFQPTQTISDLGDLVELIQLR